MKLGCCLNMNAKGEDITGIESATMLALAGYDYVEISLAQIMKFNDFAFKKFLAKLGDSGISCEACNCLFPPNIRITGDNVDLISVKRYLEQAIGRTRSIGAEIIVFGSPGAKNVPQGFSHEKARRQIIEVMHIMDSIAGDGLRIAIEPVCKREANIILNVKDGMDLYNAYKWKSIGMLVDYYHMYVENEDLSAIQSIGDVLIHTHMANPNGRVFPAEEDSVDYSPWFKALEEIEYSGRVSIEAFADDLPKAAMGSKTETSALFSSWMMEQPIAEIWLERQLTCVSVQVRILIREASVILMKVRQKMCR